MENEKQCRTCGALQPLDDFYRDKSREDGRRNSCVSCDKARKRSPEVREQSHRYYHSEKGKAAERKYYHEGNGREVRKAYNERPDVKEKRKARASAATLRYLATDKGRAYLERRKTDPRMIAIRRAQGRVDMKRRRNRKQGVPATLTEQEWQAALAYFDQRCAYCNTETATHRDHFIPLAAGGAYSAENIVPACPMCNSRKRSSMPEQWCSPEACERVLVYFDLVMSVSDYAEIN